MIMLATAARSWLVLALLFPRITAGDIPTGLIELSEANFTGTLTGISTKYDWVLIEFYAHW